MNVMFPVINPASPAVPVSGLFVPIGIFLIVGMALWAMRFRAIPVVAAPHILFRCYWLQMMRIYARPHAAKMIQLKAFGYQTNVQFIARAVRALSPKHPVAVGANKSDPKPTATIWLWGYELPKSLNRRYSVCRHLISLKDRCLWAVETFARLAAFSYFTPNSQECMA